MECTHRRRQSFRVARGRVAALEQAPHAGERRQRFDHDVAHALDARGEQLHDHHVAVAIHDQPREQVGFGVNEPIGGGIGTLSEGIAPPHGGFARARARSSSSMGASSHASMRTRDARVLVVVAATEECAARVDDVYHVAGCRRPSRESTLRRTPTGAGGASRGLASRFEGDAGHHTLNRMVRMSPSSTT